MAPVGAHPERIGAEVLGGDVRRPLPPRERLADQVCAHAARDDGRGARAGEPHDAGEAERIGAVAQAGARHRHPAPAQLVEVRAAAVERDHAHVEPAPGEPRHERRPLPLGPAGLEVRAHEHDPARARRPSSRRPREQVAVHPEHALGDRHAGRTRAPTARSSGSRPAPSAPRTHRASCCGSLGAIAHPGRPASSPGTSPTATETTGVAHASASLTTTGAPSRAMSARRRPRRPSPGRPRRARARRDWRRRRSGTDRRRRRDRRVEDVDSLVRRLGTVAAGGGEEHARAVRGHPSARRASPASTGANRSRSTAHGITGASRSPRVAATTGATAIGCVRRATSHDTRRCHGTHASLPWNVVTAGALSWSAATAPVRP